MIKIIVTIIAVFIITGCSHKTNYKSEFKQNTSFDNKYQISGNIENFTQQGFFRNTFSNRVVLYINNKLVVKAPLTTDNSGRIELYYNSKPLTIECGRDSSFSKPKCIVILDGQNLGTLNFNYDYN